MLAWGTATISSASQAPHGQSNNRCFKLARKALLMLRITVVSRDLLPRGSERAVPHERPRGSFRPMHVTTSCAGLEEEGDQNNIRPALGCDGMTEVAIVVSFGLCVCTASEIGTDFDFLSRDSHPCSGEKKKWKKGKRRCDLIAVRVAPRTKTATPHHHISEHAV